MNAHSDQISLRRYLDPIRRFAPLVLIGTLIGAGLGFGASTLTGTTYTSYVSVLVSPISGDPVDGLGTSGVDVDMETEAEVATSLLVAQRANDLLAGQPPAKDPRDLLGQLETSVRGGRIIEMGFTATEPEIAQRGAAAFADAFIAYRDELATSQLEESSGRLAERIAELQLELTDVSTRRAEVPESQREGAAYAALVISEQTLLDELSVNQGRLADLRAVITDDAVVLDSASLPRSPSSLGMMTLVVGGAAVGFVLGAGIALMLDAARRRNEDDEFTEASAVRHVLDTAAADVVAPAAPMPDFGLAAPPAPTVAAVATPGPMAVETPVSDASAPATPVATGAPTASSGEPLAAPVPASAGAAPWQVPAEPTAAPDDVIDRWAPPASDAPVAVAAEPPAAPDDVIDRWAPPATDSPAALDAPAAMDAPAGPPAWSEPWSGPTVATTFTDGSDRMESLGGAGGEGDAIDAIPAPFAGAEAAEPFAVGSPDDAVEATPPSTDPFAIEATAAADPFAAADTPMPDPFAIGESTPDPWGDTVTGAASDAWSDSPFASGDAGSHDETGAADSPWASASSGSDEDVWAGIVEAAGNDTAGADTAFSTPWDSPGTTGDDPWSTPAPGSWEPAGATPADVAPAVASLDLDGVLRERALESVAQLGDHLTNAVDVERRAVVVVDGGDGAAAPVAVAMAAHLAAGGRRILLVDPPGSAFATPGPGRYDVRDHPALEVLVGDGTTDHPTLVATAAGEDTLVVFAGTAIDSPLVDADGDWAGAIVIATTGVANPASIPGDAFDRVMGSRHPLIGIVSIMARPALAPPGN